MSSNGTSGTSSLIVSSVEPSSLPASSSEPATSSAAPSATVAESSSAAPTSAAVSSQAASSVPASSAAPSSTPADASSSADATSSTPPPSSQVVISSSQPPASSSQAPASTQVVTSSVAPVTHTTTASTPSPTTQVITSVVTPSTTIAGQTVEPSTVVLTVVSTPTVDPAQSTGAATSSASATGTAPAGLQGVDQKGTSHGLTAGGKTAIAVVVPVVVVAVCVIAGIFLWRRRKSKKNAEEARRKEVEEYGFNPNHDPTLPAVGMGSEMAEDQSGYRGWGNTTNSSNRKASTTLTSGMTYSDSNSNPGGYASPGSPTHGTHSDAMSNDPLMNRRETLDSDGIGAMGAAPNARENQTGVNRGPSNASSTYSAAGHSDGSADYPLPAHNPTDEYGYGQYNYQPYPGGNDQYMQQPVIRDVSARRNTRIENPSVFPQQGNSGIAQNF